MLLAVFSGVLLIIWYVPLCGKSLGKGVDYQISSATGQWVVMWEIGASNVMMMDGGILSCLGVIPVATLGVTSYVLNPSALRNAEWAVFQMCPPRAR